MTTANTILDELNNLDTAELSPDHGEGGRGFWPANGTYNCSIESAVFNPEGMKFKDKNSGVEKVIPTFHLTYNILDGDHAGSEVKGERWTLDKEDAPSEGAKTAREISMRRLLGVFESVLGDSNIPIGKGISALMEAVNGANPRLEAEIKFDANERKTRAGQPRTYYAEYVVSMLDAS